MKVPPRPVLHRGRLMKKDRPTVTKARNREREVGGWGVGKKQRFVYLSDIT